MHNNHTLYLTPATFADYAFINEVFEATLPLYKDVMPGSFEANLENLKRLEERGLDFSATGLKGYLLETDTARIGFAAVGPLSPRLAYLSSMYILPAYQRQGYGLETMKQLEAYYKSLAFQELCLLVHTKAPWARDFYKKAGYRVQADQPHSIVTYAGESIRHLIEPGLMLMSKSLRK